jgi:hypothetical protein
MAFGDARVGKPNRRTELRFRASRTGVDGRLDSVASAERGSNESRWGRDEGVDRK